MKPLSQAILVLLVLGAVFAVAPREPFAQPGRSERAKKKASANLKNRVQIATKGEYREIRSNGIPDHATGEFPNRHNPNVISEQSYAFRVPLEPAGAADPTRLRLGLFGVAVNGVPFDPGAAEFWNDDPSSGWQYEAMGGAIDLGLDKNNAHVQPNGAYHYHGLPVGLIANRGGGERMLLIGYAADGFPVYSQYGLDDPNDVNGKVRAMRSSYRIKSGTRPDGPRGKHDGTFVEDYEYVAGLGDLDECNGRYAATPEYPDGTYHYFVTEKFPYVPRMLRGAADASFRHHGPGPNRGGGSGRGRPPLGGPPK